MLKLTAALIRACEGCRTTAYWDKWAKVWTIGYGHTRGVVAGQVCTLAEAEAWLQDDLALLLPLVEGRHPVAAAALLSFGYNCGRAALVRLLRGEISLQNYGRRSGGVELPGLAARRDLEAALIEAVEK